jgi:hypothetical protein
MSARQEVQNRRRRTSMSARQSVRQELGLQAEEVVHHVCVCVCVCVCARCRRRVCLSVRCALPAKPAGRAARHGCASSQSISPLINSYPQRYVWERSEKRGRQKANQPSVTRKNHRAHGNARQRRGTGRHCHYFPTSAEPRAAQAKGRAGHGKSACELWRNGGEQGRVGVSNTPGLGDG